MPEDTASQTGDTNWIVVAIGAGILAAAVAAAEESVLLRVVAAVAILAATVYMSRPAPRRTDGGQSASRSSARSETGARSA